MSNFRYSHPTYIVYGPPGCGKSTTIRQARSRGIPALDLEDYWKESKRMSAEPEVQFAHTLNCMRADVRRLYPDVNMPEYLAAAGWGVRRLRAEWPLSRHVLILPPPEVYYPQRANRDALLPFKAGQADVYRYFADHVNDYDWVWSAGPFGPETQSIY